jgi:hypothetical protein
MKIQAHIGPVMGLILVLALATAAQAAQVTDLKAVHRQGQTFLTWSEPDSPVQGTTLVYSNYEGLRVGKAGNRVRIGL